MRSPSPCRSTSLPSDIWLIIIQLVDEPTVKSLSSVNELLRDIALPVVFNTLNITAPSCTHSSDKRRLYLEHILQNVRGICSVPRILNSIRRLNIISWNMERDASEKDTDYETIKLMSLVYGAIAWLVSSLPRLYRLDCQSCSIMPTLAYSIRRSSTIEFLRIESMPMSHPMLRLPTFPPSLHIFEYRVPHPYREDIVALISSHANQFTSLCLPFHTLLDQCNNLSKAGFHKLQKLTVFYNPEGVSPMDGQIFYNFLNLVPNLRELRIFVEFFSITSTVMLHNLESLTAPSRIANDIISFGLPLKKIHIFNTTWSDFLKHFKIISKDVEYVAYDSSFENPEKELTHLARMFPNATNLQITATRQRQATHEVLFFFSISNPFSHNIPQEIFDAVLSILPDLSHLKQCGVFDLCSHPTDLDRRWTVGFHCPVGRADDPKYRAHPTLEDVQILSWYRWIWIPEDGWRACDLHYAPVDLFRTF